MRKMDARKEKIEKFEDLIAWQKARALTKEIYQITRRGESAKDFGLSGQIQKASVSIMSKLEIICCCLLRFQDKMAQFPSSVQVSQFLRISPQSSHLSPILSIRNPIEGKHMRY